MELGAIPVGHGSAQLLTVLARAINAKAVVEVGTGAGVSGLAMTRGMAPDGVLTSIDLETMNQSAAREAFLAAGLSNRQFRLIAGAATDILPNLRDAAYDMVFVDADKLEYVEYVAQAQRLLRVGGLLVVDNALWHNKVADETNEDDETVIIREALEVIREDDGLIASLLPVSDGLLVAVKTDTQ
ncbi:GDP-L-fucose synthase [Platysternon megacephalum]|uniref:GDP-L-fucose synthase n=1 Tax=Platysternon megacephalum TaxID=55544 RepID=A0A4D9DC72_9SAUR|nr:GDP-L-fucose synthase [Platysternon megacephalum]